MIVSIVFLPAEIFANILPHETQPPAPSLCNVYENEARTYQLLADRLNQESEEGTYYIIAGLRFQARARIAELNYELCRRGMIVIEDDP